MNLQKLLELLEEWWEKLTRRTEKKLVSVYKTVLDKIIEIISAIFRKFEKGGKIDKEEMMKYKRKDKLQRDLYVEIDKLSKQRKKIIKDAMTETYEHSYDWTNWAIQRETGAVYKAPLIRQEAAKLALENPVTGITLDDTSQKQRTEIVQSVRAVTNAGIQNGSTYKQMADNLTESLNKDYRKAVTVVRTETHRNKEQAAIDAAVKAEDNGVLLTKKWVSLRDERVRHTPKANHVKLDGQVRPVKENFNFGGGVYGQGPGLSGDPSNDINCRCFTTLQIKGVKTKTDEGLKTRTFKEYKEGKGGN